MFIGACRLVLHLHGLTSLKAKRSIVRRVVERTRVKFNASVAEVADNDVLHRAVIGISVVSNKTAHADAMLSRIVGFVENMAVAPVGAIQTEVIPLGDESFGDLDNTWNVNTDSKVDDFSWYEDEMEDGDG